MQPNIHHPIVTAGVEEEFHIVNLATRRLTDQADKLMERLPDGSFSWELQRSVLEANSRPSAGLTDLAEDLAALRHAAIAAAEPLGLGIVAAGTVPLADPDTLQITPIRGMSTCGGSTGCWCVSSWSAARTCTPIWTIATGDGVGRRSAAWCRNWDRPASRCSGWAPAPWYASYRHRAGCGGDLPELRGFERLTTTTRPSPT